MTSQPFPLMGYFLGFVFICLASDVKSHLNFWNTGLTFALTHNFAALGHKDTAATRCAIQCLKRYV